ncbi:molybdopterin molybdotransferase MoeA [Salimicrobium humidisoli]|uniref:Molybdopterin molybdenumtransferase n=1 Tax=Salimicrobium humidisoli TaxID=2029857 RepID=A0ABX4HW18_9BACI|nr:gephyrin-like molybdotransferase Glp [Salimicrobium humidisoli]PBB07022.1 molybdopterin molybdenumtransferase [Salimicrobium humidisoli]
MLTIRRPISVEEAIERCRARVKLQDIQKVSLYEAEGRVLASPVYADQSLPPFDRSPYDGYAFRAGDTKGATGENRVYLKVIDHIGAGDVSEYIPGEKEAVRIMTGAKLPEATDAVAMFEQAREEKEGFSLRKTFVPGENVSFTGEDVQEGELLLEPGRTITAGVIALLAGAGVAEVPVYKKMKIGIIATGSELVDAGVFPPPGKIRDSNTPMIAASVKEAGAEPVVFAGVRDNEESLRKAVMQALEETDALITTGGVSVGDFDFMPVIYEGVGAEVLFNKVGMRPGSVTTVAVTEKGTFLFGLSGNPSACFTGFELFARPVLRESMGDRLPYRSFEYGRLKEAFPKKNPFTRFVRAEYDRSTGEVSPAGFNKSNAVAALAKANVLVILRGGTSHIEKGEKVAMMMLRDTEGVDRWEIPGHSR